MGEAEVVFLVRSRERPQPARSCSAARKRPSLNRLRDLFPFLAEGSEGHWRYVWRDIVGPRGTGYFGSVRSFALVLANSPRAAYAHISADAAVLVSYELLDKQPELAAKLSKTISGPTNTSEELESDFTSDSNQWLKRLALVHFEINQGDPRRALDLLRDPTLDFGHEYFPILGEVRLKLGEYREALEAFDLALARSIRCSGFALRRCYAVMR